MVDQGAFTDLAQALMAAHYDLAYARERRKFDQPLLASIALDRLDPATLDMAASRILESIQRPGSDPRP